MTDLVVGAQIREQAWAVPLWLDSICANVPTDSTGLVLVVAPSDQTTREVVRDYADRFAWVEVMRDKGDIPYKDEDYELRACGYNRILGAAHKANAEWLCVWPPDIALEVSTVEAMVLRGLRASTAWVWLNRQPPSQAWYGDRLCEYNESVKATAMGWTSKQVPIHYPGEQFADRSKGTWRTDVILGFQLLHRSAYRVVNWRPSKYGEFLSINQQLEQRGIDRYCYAESPGVKMRNVPHELELGFPGVMQFSDQLPLQSYRPKSGHPELDTLGLYAIEGKASAA